jgi:hypothetical protein
MESSPWPQPRKNNQEHRQRREATTESDLRVIKIDRTAPGSSENSLGAENVRVACPAADDGTVETIDEEVPASPLRSPPTSPEAVASCSSNAPM